MFSIQAQTGRNQQEDLIRLVITGPAAVLSRPLIESTGGHNKVRRLRGRALCRGIVTLSVLIWSGCEVNAAD